MDVNTINNIEQTLENMGVWLFIIPAVLVVYLGIASGTNIRMRNAEIKSHLFYAYITPFALVIMHAYILLGIIYYRPKEIMRYIIFSFIYLPICISYIVTSLQELQAYNQAADKLSLRKHSIPKYLFYLYTDYMILDQSYSNLDYFR